MKICRRWLLFALVLLVPTLIVGLRFGRGGFDTEPGTQFVEGVRDLSDSAVTLISIPFTSAQLEIRTGTSQRLAWSCDLGPGSAEPRVVVEAGIATLDLGHLIRARCLVSLPTRLGVEIRGQDAYLRLERPSMDMDIALNTGRVQIAADPKCAYDFDVNVKKGDFDQFPRSRRPDAVHVKVSMGDGTVKRR